MAGHSQFANIKHRKGAQDAKRSKTFTKIQREIYSAVKTCGESSEEFNPRLRLAIMKAKSYNMPNDKIVSAIKKATGEDSEKNFDAIRYDCYGPNGVSIIIEALTDNKNRTAGEVRSIITKHGGNMGETGSLDFIFTHIGIILYATEVTTFDNIFEQAVISGAQNVEKFDECYEITTKFSDLHKVQSHLTMHFQDPISANVEYRSNTKTPLSDDKILIIQKLVDAIEDLDDVQNVWTNADLT